MSIRRAQRLTVITVLTGALILVSTDGARGEFSTQGFSTQGFSTQGFSTQGFSTQGFSTQGFSTQGFSTQGFSTQGFSTQGFSTQGFSTQGFSTQGFSTQGFSTQGFSTQGFSTQGFSTQGFSTQGFSGQGMRGIDRLRTMIGPVQFRGVSRADAQFPGINLQGLQPTPSPPPINHWSVSNPMTNVWLQRSPIDSTPGSFIRVPDMPDLKGSLWNLVLADTCDTNAQCAAPATCSSADRACGQWCTADSQCASGAKCVLGACSNTQWHVPLYIADVEKDTGRNTSTSPSNDDIYLYTVYYQQPATGQWVSLCPTDDEGKARAMAVPMDARDWTSDASRNKIGFACVASGVAAKCARTWGYKPWNTAQAPFYNACVIAARADYCQDDKSFTRDGTLVDLFDNAGINNSVGFGFAPNSTGVIPGVMLHDEYRLSTNSHVIDVLTEQERAAAGTNLELAFTLLRSGLHSSRHPDLDPGRDCPAAPFIDRCDPLSMTCYRASGAQASYNPMVGVHSARNCTHSENEIGEALDPFCSLCTKRVCDRDPRCCGEAQGDFYTSSLIWDDKCLQLKDQLCRSGVDAPPWKLAQTAEAAGKAMQKVIGSTTLRGAIGSFEGFVTDAVGTHVEGWACDPDFPDTSSPVQISIGGALGAPTATLATATADQPLAPDWRANVAAECGGAGRHGFRFKLPADAAGKDVYVYGIDLNSIQSDANLHAVGAPFSLLRGGKKTVPNGASAANPRAAIWSGWIEAPASGSYVFCRQQPGTSGACTALPPPLNPPGADLYRIWVNGRFVDGNWQDVGAVPGGGFSEELPAMARSLRFEKGVRYPVRIEYLRPASLPSASEMVLLWSRDGAPPTEVPTTALYPIGPGSGNGLLGSFYLGSSLDAVPPPGSSTPYPPTVGAVDHLWTTAKPPTTSLTVGTTFVARFEGQVVPPVSGEYTFSADADGPVQIFVNRTRVTDTSVAQPGLDPNTCAHDICSAGAPLSEACAQGAYCAGLICASNRDPWCCGQASTVFEQSGTGTWDAKCVEEVRSICGLECSPTAPVTIELNAGWRYDIEVLYLHRGDTQAGPASAAKLRLMWALPNFPRAVIPAGRLLTAGIPNPLAPPLIPSGTGLNAAYFTDAAFKLEYLDRVDAKVVFRGGVLPTVTRSPGLVCGASGTPVCSSEDVIGPPALISARMLPSGGSGPVTVEIKGAGLIDNATIRLFSSSTQVAGPLVPQADGGTFVVQASLQRGLRQLTADQSLAGVTSGKSAILYVDVVDPAAPPAPQVNPPTPTPGGPPGQVTVSGKGTPGATVTVTARSGTSSGQEASTTTFPPITIGPDETWQGGITLPPGSYDVTVTQNGPGAGANSNSSAPVKVTVPLPVVTVDAPAQDSRFEGSVAVPSVLVQVRGRNANPAYGDVIVADGVAGTSDGDPTHLGYSVQIASLTPAADGTFAGTINLDPGRHELTIFQRNRGLDGPPVTRYVSIQPPAGALRITAFIAGDETIPAGPPVPTIPDSSFRVKGTALPIAGLPSFVSVYQQEVTGVRWVGNEWIDEAGGFEVPLQRVFGSGLVQLNVGQWAYSLSGGGPDMSNFVSTTVRIPPPPPTIKSPETGSALFSLPDVVVTGLASPGVNVTVIARGSDLASASTTATAAGTFTVPLRLTRPGWYELSGTCEKDGAVSLESTPPVIISNGDVTPPTIRVTPNPLPAIVATDGQGAMFNVASVVSAFDPIPGSSQVTPMPASAIQCSPSNAGPVLFPIGSTPVSCEVWDGAGNRGTTTFVVTVTINQPPVITGKSLVAEAQGPQGAVVNYQVGARGFSADCAPADSTEVRSCTNWKPAYKGLGFGYFALAQDHNPGAEFGTLYLLSLGVDDEPAATPLAKNGFFKLKPGAGQWEELTGPTLNAATPESFVIGAGTPPRILVPSDDNGVRASRGIKISADGGQTWRTVLGGIGIRRIVADPLDPTRTHLIAFRGEEADWFRSAGTEVFESRDAGMTWEPADQGLTPGLVRSVAFDTVTPDRLYLSLRVPTTPTQTVLNKVFRRDPQKPWVPLVLPPPIAAMNPVLDMAVAPGGCGQQAFPTVFAGGLESRDGGAHWSTNPGSFYSAPLRLVADRSDPCALFASSLLAVSKSLNGGRSWQRLPEGPIGHPNGISDFLQDVGGGATFYAVDYYLGPLKSTDGGVNWAPLPASGLRHSVDTIGDVAVDPVDPNIVLLSTRGGIYRSADGAVNWQLVNNGLVDALTSPEARARRIIIDRFQRNRVYVGYETGYYNDPADWMQSLDGGQQWTWFGKNGVSPTGAFALDPVAQDHWFSVDRRPPGIGGELDLRDNSGLGKFVTAAMPDGTVGAFFDPFSIQMVPDANRTVVLSWDRSAGAGAGDVNFFSFNAAAAATSSLQLAGGGYGLANVLYDGSDGIHSLFVAGSRIGKTGADAYSLYRATVEEARQKPAGQIGWVKLGGVQNETSFDRLAIDPVGGGQTMYTISARKKLWESRDGGRTWTQDKDAPPSVTAVWLSPADGSLFVTATTTWAGSLPSISSAVRQNSGRLWKRAPNNTVPLGARVFEGDLRVTCAGADPLRPTGPGSTFALGNTTLSCAAKDVFGTGTTGPITISVVDTTPPVMTIVTAPPVTSTPLGTTIPVSFAVSALDAVDGSRPVTCTPASGSRFAISVTTVTCTASDLRTPANTATIKFPVVVSRSGTTPLAPPRITIPGPVEATDPSGATLIVAASTASGAPLTPVCTPALGAVLPIGTTQVQCTATASGLSVTRAFGYVVRDTRTPIITVPGDITVYAQTAAGARVRYAATASDLVDGAIVPDCTPVSDAVLPIGATTVQCRAVDRAGNQGFAQFKVTVLDRSQATLHLPDMAPVGATDANGTRVIHTPPPSATDIKGRPVAIECFPPDETLLAVGTHTVTCTAAAGTDSEVSGTFVITVADLSAPVVTVSGPPTVEATTSQGAPVQFTRSADDAIKGSIVPQCTRSTGGGAPVAVVPGATFPFGVSIVTCTATDDYGNVGTASYTVTVGDTTAPSLTVPATVTITNCTSPNYGIVTSDLSQPVTVVTTGAPAKFALNTPTVVTHRAVDARGNSTTTRTQTVTAVLGDDQSCCPTGTNIIVGTANADTINTTSPLPRRATAGSDCILGLGGNDLINGGDGSDYISGGAGADNLTGGNGNDQLYGGADGDTLNGSAGNDLLHGGSGTDTCTADTSGTNTRISCP